MGYLKKLKSKAKVLLPFLVFTFVIVLFIGISNFLAEGDNTIKRNKTQMPNGDGTYKLSLDVTGRSIKEVNKANVIVIFDVSGSMSSATTSGHTRLGDAKSAVISLSNSLLGKNTTADPDIIEMALVSFSNVADISRTPTTSATEFANAVNRLSADGGTNWEGAFQKALDVDFKDNDPTYVIFVSDGNPTFRFTRGNYSSIESSPRYNNRETYFDHYGVYGTGSDNDSTTVSRCYEHAVDDAKALAKKYEFYTIGVYGNVDRMKSLTTESGAPENHYYSASDTSALQSALNEILDNIETSGIGAVKISDGTTTNVKANSGSFNLLKVDESSYQYWLSMDVTLEDGKYVNETTGNKITFTKGSGDTYTGSWTDENGNHSITGTIENNVFKMEWTGANDLHNFAPTGAKLVKDANDNESVDWDLSNVGTLLNGVTYTVTFDVWPTQTTYDLIADLENGVVNYSDLSSSSSSKYAGLDKYIHNSFDGKYYLDTNTTATLYYTDTASDDPTPKSVTYVNPPAVQTNVDQVDITKVWENDLDDDFGRAIEININRDVNGAQTKFYSTVLDFNNNYTKEDINIATGLMRLHKNGDGTGSIEVLETGHDYTFDELNPDYYKWELVAETIHPMLINGELKELILLDDAVTNIYKNGETVDAKYIAPDEIKNNDYYTDGTNEYVKLNGKVYLITESKPLIKAYNYRRSNLNIFKTVKDDSADANDKFKFTINVNDPGLSSGEKLWFSVYENGSVVKDGLSIIGDWTAEVKDGAATGFYYGTNGTSLTIELKVGQNLRFTNLTTKATYTIVEEDKDGYVFDGANGSAIYGANDKEAQIAYDLGTDYNVDRDNKKVTGNITMTNTTFNVAIQNKYEFANIDVTKTWNDYNDEDKIRPDSIEIQVYQNGEVYGAPVSISKNNVNPTNSNEWNYIISKVTVNGEEVNLPRYAPDGTEYNYTAVEKAISGYTKKENNTSKDGKTTYTVTNTHIPTTEVKATKVWDDNNNQDGKREDVIFKLYKYDSEGNEVAVDVETKRIAKDATGDGLTVSWTGLDKYSEGNEIIYTVKEITKILDYTTEVTKNSATRFTIKNSYTPKTTDVSVRKVWNDSENEDGKRPSSLKVRLSNGTEVTLNSGNNWSATIDGLPKYADGKEIEYTWTEDTSSLPDGYTQTGYVTDKETGITTITNTYVPGRTDIKITKKWNDISKEGIENIYGHNDSIQVKLSCKSSKADYCTDPKYTYTLNDDNGWTITESNLPKFRDGELLTFSVDELTQVNNYESSQNIIQNINTSSDKNTYEVEITNTYKPSTMSISGKKIWEDDNNNDAVRPDSIKVNLYDSIHSDPIKTIDVTGDDWTYKFIDLPITDNNGDNIKYYVDEVLDSDVYTKVVNNENFEITNYHLSETVTFNVTKIWDDQNNIEGFRPDSIIVNLLADGTKIDSIKLSNDNNWTYTFNNNGSGYKKFKNVNGKQELIVYTLEEEPVKFYEEAVIEKDENKSTTTTTDVDVKDDVTVPQTNTNNVYDITNKREVEYISISGEKIWNDSNDADKIRPEFINVKLFADGVFVKSFVISKDNNWKYILYDLYKYRNGKEIKYTIEEDPIAGYTTVIDGFNIINTHTPKENEKKYYVEVLPPKTGGEETNNNLLVLIMLINVLGLSIIGIKNN